jgi:carbamoyltransferase
MGPRALGNRSILADPRHPDMKNVLNRRVKHREPFRPFAPAVLAERAPEWFDVRQPVPFMSIAARIRPEKAEVVPAAVHVDGTARIQTVHRPSNPRFHALISSFAQLTGVPMVLNTSFNQQEPIVAGPAEAISCYLRSEINVLVLGHCYTIDRNSKFYCRGRGE